MKNVFIISASIVLLIVCYNLKHAGLTTGIIFYIAGCGTVLLCRKLFPNEGEETFYKYDEYDDELEFYTYTTFRNESGDTIWDNFLADMYDDDTLSFVSDDREKFYNDNIEKYSNQLDAQIADESIRYNFR